MPIFIYYLRDSIQSRSSSFISLLLLLSENHQNGLLLLRLFPLGTGQNVTDSKNRAQGKSEEERPAGDRCSNTERGVTRPREAHQQLNPHFKQMGKTDLSVWMGFNENVL